MYTICNRKDGENYNNDDLIDRYGDFTGPYAVNKFEETKNLKKNTYIGGMINCSDKYTNPNVNRRDSLTFCLCNIFIMNHNFNC